MYQKKSIKEILVFILMGFMAFSSFSSLLMIEWLKMPLLLPELLLIPFIPFLKKRKIITSNILTNQLSLILLYIWLALVIIALFISDYNPYSILSSSRGFLYLALCYSLFSKKDNFTLDNIMYICLGSLIGWAVASYFNLQKSIIITDETVSYGTMLAIPIFICISLFKRKYSLFLIGMIFIIFVSLTAGLRRQMFIVIFSLTLSLLLLLINNKQIFLKTIPITIVIIMSTIFVLPKLEVFLNENSPILYKRIFVRTENTINRNFESGDEVRISNINYLIDNIDKYMIPRGFVSKRTKYDEGTGVYNDFPLLELGHTLSIPITFFLISYIINLGYQNFRLYLIYRQTTSYVYFICFVIIITLLFLDGTFITYPYTTPITGFCLGKLKYYSNRKNLL